MSRTIGLKTVKVSTSKPNGKPPHGDNNIELDTSIRFYEIEDGGSNEEGA